MTIKEIDQALEEGDSLKQIAQAYSEIANLKIKRIRVEAERNRIFFAEISRVYAMVKKLAAEKKINTIKPKNTISMILTSNHKFYGSINADLLEFYVTSTQKIETDHIFLGKAAIDYFRANHSVYLRGGATEVLLKEDQPDTAELMSLVNMLNSYNKVLVFYSSMKSLLVQQPLVMDITASSATEIEVLPQAKGKEPPKLKFIFEPELAQILHFFDSQIITLLLEGAFLESELSRTASRFISMDSAETEANKFIKEYQKIKAYAKRNLENKAILENFASMMAVKRQ